MTFEEIQKIIEGMLAVQRDLQESQLRLAEESQRQQRILNQLISYSLTNEEDHLDLEQQLQELESRVSRLEN